MLLCYFSCDVSVNAFISHLLEMTTHILLHKRRSIQHGGTRVTCNWLSIKLQECEKKRLVVIGTRTVFLYSLKSHTGKLSSPISTLSWNSCYTHITLLSTSPALPQLTCSFGYLLQPCLPIGRRTIHRRANFTLEKHSRMPPASNDANGRLPDLGPLYLH